MSQQVLEKSPEITNTPEETMAKAKEAYAGFGKNLDKSFDEIVSGKSQQTIEEIAKLLPEAENVQKTAHGISEAQDLLAQIRGTQ